MSSGPGYTRYPEHHVEAQRLGRHLQIKVAGEVIAESDDAIEVDETNHDPVFYVPRKDVRMEILARNPHHTRCPFRGEASYFDIVRHGRTIPNAVWSYEQPYDEVGVIKDHVAFYPHKVDSITVG